MLVNFVERKVTLEDARKEVITKKLAKLDKFFTETASAKVKVSEEGVMKCVEVTVADRGMLFRAGHKDRDEVACIDEIVDLLTRQIRKNKTRLERRFRQSLPFAGEIEEQEAYNIVKRRSVALQAMNVEDAILEMNMLGHAFYMFLEKESNKICVVYRRNDGDYAVLEPEEN